MNDPEMLEKMECRALAQTMVSAFIQGAMEKEQDILLAATLEHMFIESMLFTEHLASHIEELRNES